MNYPNIKTPFSKLLLLVCSLLFSLPSLANSEGILFEKNLSLEEMTKLAKEKDKLIFVDAYADWCGPCRWMAQNTFTHESVATFFNQNFINVKVDVESEKGQKVAELFEVSAMPTILFLDQEGKVIRKHIGALDPNGLLDLSAQVLDPTKDPLYGLKKRYDEGDREPYFLVEYITNLIDRNQTDGVEPIVNEYWEDRKGKLNTKDTVDVIMFYLQTSSSNDRQVKQWLKDPKSVHDILGDDKYINKVSEVLADLVTKGIQNEDKKVVKKMEDFIDDSLGFLDDQYDLDDLKQGFRENIEELQKEFEQSQ